MTPKYTVASDPAEAHKAPTRGDLSDPAETPMPPMQSLSRRDPLGPGRLGSYAAMGAAIGLVPLPWLPEALTNRVRGALVRDVARRHGLSLSGEARTLLSAPFGPPLLRGFAGQAIAFASARWLGRIGPLAILAPARGALSTFVLGHLFCRYVASLRKERAVRIDTEEARKVRRAIEAALLRAFTTPALPDPVEGVDADDVRDEVTRMIDGVLEMFASLPGWLVRRLDAAFDASFE